MTHLEKSAERQQQVCSICNLADGLSQSVSEISHRRPDAARVPGESVNQSQSLRPPVRYLRAGNALEGGRRARWSGRSRAGADGVAHDEEEIWQPLSASLGTQL